MPSVSRTAAPRPGRLGLGLAAALLVLAAAPAEAYVGPGAGIALLSSVGVVLVTLLLAIGSILAWPFRALWRLLTGKKTARPWARRFISVGLDGQDPRMTDRLMAEGKLPNLKRLAEQGCYHRIRTTFPSMTPVAWSSYSTGVNPGKHNIFDFLDRDRSKHDAIKCGACHKSAVYKDAPRTCIGCHRKDDKHKGALGEPCGNCHTERNWKESKFDHAKTKFPLLQSHARVKCETCHRDPDYARTPKDCYGCHKKDDKHEGQVGTKCESCHDAGSWKKAQFDHARARFPLLGGHLVVPCKKCHETPRYRDAKRDCVGCHERDDVHKRRLGPACETCHNARSWKSWDFNHDRQTKFALDGAHRKINCDACHRQPVERRATLPSSCVSCHAAEDVHDGGFGKQCERCHVTSSFKQIRQRLGLSWRRQ